MRRISSQKISSVVISAIVVAVTVASFAFGQVSVPPDARLELQYIQQLQNAYMPDYAELVIKDFEIKFPNLKPLVAVAKLEQLLGQGKFEDAKDMIAAEKNQESADVWAMTLTLADYYYAFGKYVEAKKIYADFFNKYKDSIPEDIKSFYTGSLYKYAQMLLYLGENEPAMQTYNRLLAIEGLDEDTKRQTTFEAAELGVRLAKDMKPGKERDELFAKAKTRTDSLLWNLDLWFGRALVLMAHVEVINGDIASANKLIEGYMPQLRSIEKQLQDISKETGEDLSRLSPIAEVIFLKSVMMQEDAKTKIANPAATQEDMKIAREALVEALQGFVNVYAQYPSTSWAPDALVRSEEVQEVLKSKFGAKEIRIDVSEEQRRDIATKQFTNARVLFNQNQYEKAIDAYMVVLNQFPESVPDSIMALSELARSYISFADSQKEEEDKEYSGLAAEAVTGHLAERFAKADKEGMTIAGDELRRIAEVYGERQNTTMREATYNLFFTLYPEHGLAANMLMSFAEKKYKDKDFEGAIPYYTTLMESYKKSPVVYTAMLRLADCYSQMKNTAAELAVRKEYVARVAAREKPGQALVTGMYMLARMNRNEALNELRSANSLVSKIRREGPVANDVNGTAAPAVAETNTVQMVETTVAEGTNAAPAVITMESAMKSVEVANRRLTGAANDFAKIINMLNNPETRKKYEKDAREKDLNNNVLQGCLFDRSYTLSAITQPADKLSDYKKGAIQGYEEFLKKFPDAKGIPTVLMQLGTLYSTLKTDDPAEQAANMKKADEMFSRLNTEHPESEEAKNAYFMRGRTLIELGFRQEGIEVLKMMFSDSGKYSASQMYHAAEELFKSEEYELARQGYELAISMSDKDQAITVPSQLSLARIMLMQKKFTDALSALEKFISENPSSYYIIEANDMLAQAATMAAFEEPDRENRVKLFNRSFNSLVLLEKYLTSDKDKAEISIKKGKILETKIDVERSYNNQDLVDQYLAEATLHYQRFTASANDQDAAVLPSLEHAYFRLITLLLEMKEYSDGTTVYEDVKSDALKYIELFPGGAHITEIRAALTSAEIGISSGGR